MQMGAERLASIPSGQNRRKSGYRLYFWQNGTVF